jgi:hypothetical protein
VPRATRADRTRFDDVMTCIGRKPPREDDEALRRSALSALPRRCRTAAASG